MYLEHMKWQWLTRILSFLPLSILCAYWFLSTHHRISWVYTLIASMYLLYGLKIVEQRYGFKDQESALLATLLTWCWPLFIMLAEISKVHDTSYKVFINQVQVGEITHKDLIKLRGEVFFSPAAIYRQCRFMAAGLFITIKDLAMVTSTGIVLGSAVYIQIDSLGFRHILDAYIQGHYNYQIISKGAPLVTLWVVVGLLKNTQWSIFVELDTRIRIQINQAVTGELKLVQIPRLDSKQDQVENSPK
jgi:hypothetical protein